MVNKLELNPTDARFQYNPGDTIVTADITVIAKDGRLYNTKPSIILNNHNDRPQDDTVTSQSLIFHFSNFADIQKKKVGISIKESSAVLDYITIKVYQFPNINILWIGILVMVIGTIMSLVRRVKMLRNSRVA